MLEVDVTRLTGELDPSDLSASQAERGRNAGPETWRNSVDAAKAKRVLRPNERQQARDYFAEFGAWTSEEIAAWKAAELDALVLQYAAGDLRELQSLAPGDGVGGIDWKEAQELSKRGTCAGNLFPDNGRLYISLSH
jgi:hypothetical protein